MEKIYPVMPGDYVFVIDREPQFYHNDNGVQARWWNIVAETKVKEIFFDGETHKVRDMRGAEYAFVECFEHKTDAIALCEKRNEVEAPAREGKELFLWIPAASVIKLTQATLANYRLYPQKNIPEKYDYAYRVAVPCDALLTRSPYDDYWLSENQKKLKDCCPHLFMRVNDSWVECGGES